MLLLVYYIAALSTMQGKRGRGGRKGKGGKRGKEGKGGKGGKGEGGVAVEDEEEGAELVLEELEDPLEIHLHQNYRVPCDHMINYIISHATISVHNN